MYFTPDGKSAIVVAEAFKRLDFRDPHTMALQYRSRRRTAAASTTPTSRSTARYVIFTCEFQGSLVKVDLVTSRCSGYLQLAGGGMPQDIRVSPDGKIVLRRPR